MFRRAINLSTQQSFFLCIINLKDVAEKRRSLKAYANTYLKEEVWGEQLVRKIEPFRRFLQIAAQTHG